MYTEEWITTLLLKRKLPPLHLGGRIPNLRRTREQRRGAGLPYPIFFSFVASCCDRGGLWLIASVLYERLPSEPWLRSKDVIAYSH